MAGLSKSQCLRGFQCHKSLWLYRNRKDLISETPASTQFKFDEGHRIGELARTRFPGGRLISDDHLHIPQAIRSTRSAARDGVPILFEAAAMHDRVLARADILIRRGSAWDLIEVKGSTQVKNVHLEDVAVQKYAFDGAGFPIRKCFMMHVSNQYVRRGAIDADKFFSLVDVTKEVASLGAEMTRRVSELQKVLFLKEAPEIGIGPHCSSPYDCDFIGHCWEHVPEYSVYDLVRIRQPKIDALLDRGIMHVREVPEDFQLSDPQRLQVSVEKSGRPHVDRSAIAKILRGAKYPLYFLDFETFSTAIPLYDGLRPFQQVPFQTSVFVQRAEGEKPRHREYLGNAWTDPRVGLVAFLRDAIGPSGTVVAYNASFEGARLAELAVAFPETADHLNSIKERLWDLALPFRSGLYVHPGFQGSWSLKAVLPALVRGMTYDGMGIRDGSEASIAYLSLMDGGLSSPKREKTIAALRKYCRQDTLAMVKLLQVLRKITRNG